MKEILKCLKPCPRCNNAPCILEFDSGYSIECSNEDCSIAMWVYNLDEDAINQWNKRV